MVWLNLQLQPVGTAALRKTPRRLAFELEIVLRVLGSWMLWKALATNSETRARPQNHRSKTVSPRNCKHQELNHDVLRYYLFTVLFWNEETSIENLYWVYKKHGQQVSSAFLEMRTLL